MEASSWLHALATLPRGTNPGINSIGSWVCPRAGMDFVVKKKACPAGVQLWLFISQYIQCNDWAIQAPQEQNYRRNLREINMHRKFKYCFTLKFSLRFTLQFSLPFRHWKFVIKGNFTLAFTSSFTEPDRGRFLFLCAFIAYWFEFQAREPLFLVII
jgi:hypothetical protein